MNRRMNHGMRHRPRFRNRKPTLETRTLTIEVTAASFAELEWVAREMRSTLSNACFLLLLAALHHRKANLPSFTYGKGKTMYHDQFGKPIEAGRVYGIGKVGASPTKCVPHQTLYDPDIDELVIRRLGPKEHKGEWERLYADPAYNNGAGMTFVLLDSHLTPYESDPRELEAREAAAREFDATSETDGTELDDLRTLLEFLSEQYAAIEIDQNKMEVRERFICKRLGVTIGDGSDLADMVTRFVRDPLSVTIDDLIRATNDRSLAGTSAS